MQTQTIERETRIRESLETVPIRAAIYARHSSTKQNALSCEEQIDRIRYLIKKNEVRSKLYPNRSIQIEEEWVIKDEAISGKTASREGYSILLDAMGNKQKFDILITDDVSRLNRDLGNTLKLYELSEYSEIEIISISDNLSSKDPNARMYFTVKGMISDWGNEAHAMRTLRGMEAKILKGLSAGDTCYGYYSKATRMTKEGGRDVPRDYEILIDENESKVVQKIFKLFIKGHGRTAICRILNDEKIAWPGFSSNPPRGKGWAPATVHKILTNRKYIGVWVWKQNRNVLNPQTGQKVQKMRPENEWVSHNEGKQTREDLRIISQADWNKAQGMFEEIHKQNPSHGNWGRYRSSVPLHMLSGILRCEVCNGAIVVASGRKGGFYGCCEAKVKRTCSQQRLIRRLKLERIILNYLSEQIQDESLFQEAAKHYNRLMNDKLAYSRDHLEAYEQELATIEIELNNAAEAVLKGGNSETLTRVIQEKEKRKRYLTYQVHQIRANDQERIFVTPLAVKDKFKKLVNTMQKDPQAAFQALKKVFSEGLKMKWTGEKWEIKGAMIVGQGLRKEIELVTG